MNVTFSTGAWEDYQYWQKADRKILQRINRLIDESCRTPFEGIGKPEPLRHVLQGAWSRRIDDEHRLVYVPGDEAIFILSCRHHY